MSENEVERDLGPGAVGDPDKPGDPSTPVQAPQPEQPQAEPQQAEPDEEEY